MRLLAPSPPGRLPLHAAKRAEVAVGAEELAEERDARRADELFLQVRDADVEAEALQVRTRPGCAHPSRREAALDDVLFRGITQAGQNQPRSLGAEVPQVARKRVGTADRDDRDSFRGEIPAPADGQRLDGHLVADALDQDDGGPGGGHRLGSDGGSPNRGSTLASNRIIALTRSPLRARTYRPVPRRTPTGALR